jgi:hypothetical protein
LAQRVALRGIGAFMVRLLSAQDTPARMRRTRRVARKCQGITIGYPISVRWPPRYRQTQRSKGSREGAQIHPSCWVRTRAEDTIHCLAAIVN